MPVGKRDPYWGKTGNKAKVLWKCTHCEHLEATEKNVLMGFDDWSGVLICKRCGSNMIRKELTKNV